MPDRTIRQPRSVRHPSASHQHATERQPQMFLGLDLGTSALKAILVDGDQNIVAQASIPLTLSRPAPGHAEQDPAHWWQATLDAIDTLHREHPAPLSAVEGIGLSGQMHGAILLNEAGRVLRPAILWNDTRAAAECATLERTFPALRQTTGNLAMPGFTAPKLLWVRTHEPNLFAQTRTVLLPKAWLAYQLTGEIVEEKSDASGTLWLDVAARTWSTEALAATGLTTANMPRLIEGSEPGATLHPHLAARWHMTRPPILAGGAGDNAAGAIGLSAIHPGNAFVSLGTSGVLFAVTDQFRPYPQAAVHAFCHAIPNTWHQMGVTLSAAASLAWWSAITGQPEAALLQELPPIRTPSSATFLPYLGGERTPHNDGTLRAAFTQISNETDRPALTQAVLEGVAFSLRDALDAIIASGTRLTEADVIGGGSRSRTWIAIIAAALNLPLHRLESGEQGGAFGAARLARLAVTNEPLSAVCLPPKRAETIHPDPALAEAYAQRLQTYRSLGEIPALKHGTGPQ